MTFQSWEDVEAYRQRLAVIGDWVTDLAARLRRAQLQLELGLLTVEAREELGDEFMVLNDAILALEAELTEADG
jgi:hypothetical protein